MQLKAVSKAPYAIQFIDIPSEQVQLEALKVGRGGTDILAEIKNPTKKVLDYAKRKE